MAETEAAALAGLRQARAARDRLAGAQAFALQALVDWSVAREQRSEFLGESGRRQSDGRLVLTAAEQREYEPLDQRYREAEAFLVVAGMKLRDAQYEEES